MNILSNLLFILVAILILMVAVVIHEFGHYLAGRLCGIGVLEFSVGMGPKLFGWRRKEIDYSLRAVPIGGYCKFLGEDEDASDPRAMNNQKVWKRIITVAAGPLMNLILAFIVAVILLAGGQMYETVPAVATISEQSPAEAAGIQVGDRITQINGEAIAGDAAGTMRAREIITASADSALEITVDRGGQPVQLTLTPQLDDETGRYIIGVTFGAAQIQLNAFQAMPRAVELIGSTMWQTVTFLKNMVVGLFKGQGIAAGSVSGPVGIVSTVSSNLQSGFRSNVADGFSTVLYWIMLISMSLGIMNLLPLPALDGGRLVFLVIEGIRRKPIDREKEGMVHFIGFILLLVLIVVITWNDIAALF